MQMTYYSAEITEKKTIKDAVELRVHWKFVIARFHTSGAWVQSVYYGINNTRPIYSERAHRALQNPSVSC